MLSHVLCSQIDGADCCSLGCPTHLCFQTFHDLVESCHHLPEVSIKSFSPYLPTYLICRSLLIGDVHYLSHHEKGLSLKFCTNGKFPIQFHSRDLSFINIMQSILLSSQNSDWIIHFDMACPNDSQLAIVVHHKRSNRNISTPLYFRVYYISILSKHTGRCKLRKTVQHYKAFLVRKFSTIRVNVLAFSYCLSNDISQIRSKYPKTCPTIIGH